MDDLILNSTPEKHFKNSELSKNWHPDSRSESTSENDIPIKLRKCDKTSTMACRHEKSDQQITLN